LRHTSLALSTLSSIVNSMKSSTADFPTVLTDQAAAYSFELYTGYVAHRSCGYRNSLPPCAYILLIPSQASPFLPTKSKNSQHSFADGWDTRSRYFTLTMNAPLAKYLMTGSSKRDTPSNPLLPIHHNKTELRKDQEE